MSSDLAISVRGLGKSYTIAHDRERHVTLAEAALSRLRHPLRRPKTETFHALKDVSFDIRQGDVVGIIGRNGAGKSTLLKVLSRITEPTAGEIDVYGRVGSLLEVGTGFHPELTGRENIFLNGAILGMSKAEIRKQFDAIVDFAGVEQFLDTPVKRYSSGMYVRLAFAVAAHLESEILVVDEVLAVGDAEFQKRCLGKIQSVARSGRTVLFVSHSVATVQSLCSTSLFLENGRVREFGRTDEIVASYISRMESGVGPRVVRGTAGLTLESAELIDEETGLITRQAYLGGDYRLSLRFRAERRLENCGVVLRVSDEAGVLVSAMCTPEEGIRAFPVFGECAVECSLPTLQLYPRRYSIEVMVGEHGEWKCHLLVQDALEFEVLPRVVVGGSSPYSRHHGFVRIVEGMTVESLGVRIASDGRIGSAAFERHEREPVC